MRKELHHRPLILIAAAMALATAGRVEPHLLLGLLGIFFLDRTLLVRSVIVFFAVIAYGRAPLPAKSILENTYLQGPMRIASVPAVTKNGFWALVEVGGGRFQGFFPAALDMSYGDTFDGKAVAKPFEAGRRANWALQGVSGTMTPVELTEVSRGPALLRCGLRWRDSFRAFTRRWLPPASSGVLDALCFNVNANLDDSLSNDLKRTGTFHIVSASGLHVLIFSLFLQGLLSILPIRRNMQLLLVIAVLIIYMGAAGLNPPIVRSVLMAAVMMAGSPLRREGDLLSALGFAAMVTILLNPTVVFEMGAQLSFAAVGGLGLFQRYESGEGWRQSVRQALWSSGVATAVTLPLLAYFFGYVSLISIVANLLIAPLASAMVVVALGAWAVSFGWSFLSLFAVALLGKACDVLSWLVHLFAMPTYASVDVPAFSGWLIPLYYLALIGLWRHHDRPA